MQPWPLRDHETECLPRNGVAGQGIDTLDDTRACPFHVRYEPLGSLTPSRCKSAHFIAFCFDPSSVEHRQFGESGTTIRDVSARAFGKFLHAEHHMGCQIDILVGCYPLDLGLGQRLRPHTCHPAGLILFGIPGGGSIAAHGPFAHIAVMQTAASELICVPSWTCAPLFQFARPTRRRRCRTIEELSNRAANPRPPQRAKGAPGRRQNRPAVIP